jgi:hypothetical protein
MMLTEGRTAPTQAFMVDLHLIPIQGGEDPPAGTLRQGADGRVPRRVAAPLLRHEGNALLGQETVDPVLHGASWEMDAFRDLGDGERSGVESALPHQP